MLIRMLKSKLHMALCTQTALTYHGSITIDESLMEAVGLLPHEAVLIGNVANGLRAETYCIPGKRGGGDIQMNGAMARLAQPGDRLIILSFAWLDAKEVPGHKPKVAILDASNKIVEQWEA